MLLFFAHSFPTISHTPPTGSIPHMPPTIGSFNRPMLSVATDVAGNFTGATVVQGTDANGVMHQAGLGDMFEFDAVFNGSVTVAKAGQLTFSFYNHAGFLFGPNGAPTTVPRV